ncbi:VOC family protein [Streptoalloteichus hindustanus]|uniref:Glyoxalase/Bleomycin resistance protein/Dioxygenase superfamily protein n=1 Tax=Streptoalloteichus hindustanus TaxID=2017 RepID=A4KUD3_STRHI|nr:VOC family protein [Streptoalloteichus hindustanus]ABL74961.1 TlmK [Streptoalloteichus hindustanus]SHF86438.1 Glyoxalase/Bleomycin resistance protein/Dioxygenase superfamily protein [Streptoalloteichus hindustanus]
MGQSWWSLSGAMGVPCLLVGDLRRAAEYYREVLGFDVVEPLGDPTTAVLARRAEGAVLLQLAPDDEEGFSHREFADRAWDALFLVDDIGRVASQLRSRRANIEFGIGITEVSDRTLEVRDEWGNILAFAATYDGLRPAVRQLVERTVPGSVRTAWRNHRFAREERPELAAFQRFYQRLESKRAPVYMYFTTGLLHWVIAAERHVPADVNLVLIGSGLSAVEQRWIRENLARPFHNIALEVDDNTVWEFLFATNQFDFAYMDIDCFVLEPAVFADMMRFPRDAAVNAIWTYEAAPGTPIGCTHFVAINVEAARDLRRRGRYMSPTNYDWDGSMVHTLHHRTYCRVPTPRQTRLLLQVLPADERGRPLPPGDSPFFDTLVAYQIAAATAGYRTNPVRPMAHRTQATFAEQNASDERVWQQDMTDELLHVGGISYYGRVFHASDLRRLYLSAEHTLLSGSVDRLPTPYADRLRTISRRLEHLGVDPGDAAKLIFHHLVSDRGLAVRTAERVLAQPAPDLPAGA